MAIVEQAVATTPISPPSPPEDRGRPRIVGYDKAGYPIVRQGWKTVEQIAADLRARYPNPINSGPSSIDLIREDRDSR